MTNSISKYDLFDFVEEYDVRDYNSKKLSQIYNMSEITDNDYIDYYKLTDNETIEQVSYKLYKTTKYWDVLLYINQADPLFSMVYDFDFSSDISRRFIDYYNDYIYSNPDLPEEYLNELKESRIEEIEDSKEERRSLKIIRPNKIADFMKILRQREII